MDAATTTNAAEPDGIALVRWADPARQDKIRRLYETDARGMSDDALLDDVGCALYLRCRSILAVTAAVRGQVSCPRCGSVIRRVGNDNSPRSLAERLCCPDCGWHTCWGRFRETFQGRQLYGAGGLEAFATFLTRFDAAHTAREKLFAIDRLIHAFHYNLSAGATVPSASRPAAANVIEGTLGEVIGFLDHLTYGDATTPEMRANRAAYEENLPKTWAGKRYRPAL